jgi:hypothetical protein
LKNPADRRAALRALAAWGLAAGLATTSATSALADVFSGAVPAEVTQLRLEHADDSVYLNASVQFELPPLVTEVLEKGIAIFFVAEGELFQERWYWADRKVAQASRHMRLAYQPLTRRWRLNVSPVPITNAGLGVAFNQNFDSLGDALAAIKRIGRLRLGDAADISDAPVHPVTFRFRLDVSQLPRPLQIGFVGNADWNMTAERNARLPLESAP